MPYCEHDTYLPIPTANKWIIFHGLGAACTRMYASQMTRAKVTFMTKCREERHDERENERNHDSLYGIVTPRCLVRLFRVVIPIWKEMHGLSISTDTLLYYV